MKILSWNMGAAYGFKGAKHAAAWEWLNAQDADVAMLQEVEPREEYLDDWKSVAFAGKWKNWGSAVLVRDGGVREVGAFSGAALASDRSRCGGRCQAR